MLTMYRSVSIAALLLASSSAFAQQPQPVPPQPQPGQPTGQPQPGQPQPQPQPGQPQPQPQPQPGQPTGQPGQPGQPTGQPGQPTQPTGQPGQPMPGQPMPGQPMQPMPGQPGQPYATGPQPYPSYPQPENPEDANKPKEPKKGDFDAGGRVRFPNGPDEMGEYETYNWVAFDLVGRYFLLDGITVNGNIPIAIIKPDMALVGGELRKPGRIGGLAVRFDLKLPKSFMAKMPTKQARDTEFGLTVTGAYMHEGALLLSDRDFPLFVGKFHPGLVIGAIMKVKLGSIVDFNLLPVWTSQYGETESRQGVQVPMDLTIKIGSLVKLALELGVFTGDDYSGRGKNGGRIPLGASLDVKLGPIIAHLGAGWATLTTGPLYPTVRDSIYVDVNVKFAK